MAGKQKKHIFLLLAKNALNLMPAKMLLILTPILSQILTHLILQHVLGHVRYIWTCCFIFCKIQNMSMFRNVWRRSCATMQNICLMFHRMNIALSHIIQLYNCAFTWPGCRASGLQGIKMGLKSDGQKWGGPFFACKNGAGQTKKKTKTKQLN